MDAYVAALEAPLSRDEGIFDDFPENKDESPVVQLSRCELRIRRATIKALRAGAVIKRDGEWLDISIYSPDYKRLIMKNLEIRKDLQTITEDFCERIESTKVDRSAQMNYIASCVAKKWSSIPYC